MRLGPWVQSEAPRLSLGRGGEPRAHSVPRSRIFPRPHSSDIADTTLPHALTLLRLGYSSETWWQSRLASSTRRFAQVRARPCHRSPPRRHARALHRSNAREYSDRRAHPLRRRRSCDRNAAPRRAHRTQPHAATLTRRPWHAGSCISHWSYCAAGVWALALPCAMALGDGRMLGGEQAASCMEYGVVSASTMACHAARHTLCVASKPRRLSDS